MDDFSSKLKRQVTQIDPLLEILTELAANWTLFLGQLGLPQGKIEQISRDTGPRSLECLRNGLFAWVQSTENPTYEQLCGALRSEVVGQNQLAKSVEDFVATRVPESGLAAENTFSVKMTCEELAKWLSVKGVDIEDCQIFYRNKITGPAFAILTESHLVELGVSFGAKVILLELLSEISMSLTSTSSSKSQAEEFPKLQSTDQGPSMSLLQLLKWRSHDDNSSRNVRIISETALKWETMGELLGLSAPELASIKMKNRENPSDCVREMFGKWLMNGSQLSNAKDYPVTWKGLYNLLRDSELTEVASSLCEALGARCSNFKRNFR